MNLGYDNNDVNSYTTFSVAQNLNLPKGYNHVHHQDYDRLTSQGLMITQQLLIFVEELIIVSSQ